MKINRIFAIIDPTSDNENLINRLNRIAQRADSAANVSIHAYCCHYSNAPTSDPRMFERVARSRMEMWINSLFSELVAAGMNVTTEVEWDPDWREAVPRAAASANCDMIIKNSYSHRSDLRLSKQIDRAILRKANAPVLLLRSGLQEGNGIVLGAIKLAELDDAHERANTKVIDYCRGLEAISDRFKFHAVSVYSGAENFIYPEDLAKKVGIDRTRAHSIDGSPASGIEMVAKKLDAEVVFLGCVKKGGVKGRLLGTTGEQLLDTLPADLALFIQD